MKMEYVACEKALKDVYCAQLMELAKKDERIVLLDSDLMSSLGVTPFFQAFPKRAFNCGIQEANMIGVAAGMSATGMIPFTHSFGCFASRRCIDQIYVSAAYARLNVKMLGSDPGITSAYNGGTHQAYDDMGMLRSIPEVTLVEIVDETMLKALLPQIASEYGVCYIRLNRKAQTKIFDEHTDIQLRKGIELKRGHDVTIVASGIMLEEAIKAETMLASEGISAGVLNIHTWKPIDRELLLQCAARSKAFVSAENHNVINGLGDAVAGALCEVPVILKKMGVQDRFGEVGSVDYLKQEMNMTCEDIARAAREVVALKNSTGV